MLRLQFKRVKSTQESEVRQHLAGIGQTASEIVADAAKLAIQNAKLRQHLEDCQQQVRDWQAEAGRQEARRNTWKALARRLYCQREGYLATIEQLHAGWDETLARALAAEARVAELEKLMGLNDEHRL